MIVFDLQCRDGGHVFEAWFSSTADYEQQSGRGLVECPVCECATVAKAPMAPRVPRKTGETAGVVEALAKVQAEMLCDSEWVGEQFADKARAMHHGEIERRMVHGQATVEQASALVEEGVPIAPLPLPVVPPSQVN